MIEPEVVIDPEAAAPAASSRRGRQALIAGVTALAVLAGAVAVFAGGGSEPKPLSLMAGNVGDSAGGRAEAMSSATPAVAPVPGMAADSRLSYYGGWGLKFEVAGDLPALADHAPAWRATGPTLDRAAVARIAGALGLTGTPVQRDGGWFVENGELTMSAFPGGDTWSVNLYRTRYALPGETEPPAGPALSAAEIERRVRDLLERMGAPAGVWKFETTATEMGVGWSCAAPAPALSPEELRKLETEKLRQLEQPNSVATDAAQAAEVSARDAGTSSGAAGSGSAGTTLEVPADRAAATPAGKPGPDGPVSSCPPPPAPVKGFNVALYPLLDGQRADWPIWNVTLRSDGRIENLYGSWVTFERGDDYKLRGVDAALRELQSPAQPPFATAEGRAVDTPVVDLPPQPFVATTEGQAVDLPAAAGGATPAIEPAPCPPVAMPMPMPADDIAKSAVAPADAATTSAVAPSPGCAPPAPQVVTITGVELGLLQTSVFEDKQVRMALVPSYRFVGRFDNGSPWATSVIALHPDAIAPPPDVPVTDDVRSGGGATGIGKAVPPMPPGIEPAPAVISDPDAGR